MRSLWQDSEARGKDTLDQLVYRSRLIGRESQLCVWGGGNTSTKRVERDHLGRTVRVLWVKGSGSDLKVSERKHFSPLRLDDLLPLLKRTHMSDEEMVDLLTRSLLDPKAPRPSIEALLHAFLPFQDIDHSHADSILALTNTTRGREMAQSIYGAAMIWIPYVKPGFTLSKKLYEASERNKEAQGAILEKHGVITWGNSSKESYQRMIEVVSRAERYIHRKVKKPFGRAVHTTLSQANADDWLRKFLPVIRKAVSKNKRLVLHVVRSRAVLEFVNSLAAPRVSQEGPATPDHMLRTKRVPLFAKVDVIACLAGRQARRHAKHGRPPTAGPPEAESNLRNCFGGRSDLLAMTDGVESYARAHERYFRRYRRPGMQMLDPYPRVILVPGVGMITTGKDKDAAIQCAEVYEHSIATMRGAQAVDRYRSLPPARAFEIEYWPLELYKLTLAPPEKSLARKIALVTGATGGIGRAIAAKLVREGAHLAMCDLDAKKTRAFAEELVKEFGTGRAIGLRMDVTREAQVEDAFSKTVLTFGGLDIVVSNAGIAHIAPVAALSLRAWEQNLDVNATGHFLVAREAMKIFKRQGLGGNLIFITTKNVLAPGKDFGAYSASKSAEAQLARICAIEGGEIGVRSNMVNPDGVFDGSGLWSREVRKNRARSYGIPVERLEEFYRNRNLLKTRVRPEDVANTVAFLASDESAKTTGCILTVDGGVREAFPR